MPIKATADVFQTTKLATKTATLKQSARCNVVGSTKKTYEILLPNGSKGWVSKKSVTRIDLSSEEFKALEIQSDYGSSVVILLDPSPDDSIMLLMPDGPSLSDALGNNKDKEQQQRDVQ